MGSRPGPGLGREAGVYRVAVFIICSAGILAMSRKHLRDPHHHGFYRFFSFECLLGLILLNVPRWFVEPFSVPQLLSWTLLAASLVLAVHSFRLLRGLGEPKGAMDETTALVRRGAFRYIRHPLYASLLLLGWGALLKGLSVPTGLLALGATGLLYAAAKVEESENRRKFGEDYVSYMRSTKLFIPFLF
jgi:protein-S-isoprenylcysteine O-methyltransferase Ste14